MQPEITKESVRSLQKKKKTRGRDASIIYNELTMFWGGEGGHTTRAIEGSRWKDVKGLNITNI